jgi:site-specific DNA-methyltransferase (adenine-specific)
LDTVQVADCIEFLASLPDKCVDATITDPPYGVTQNAWDKTPDWAAWWSHIARVCKGAVVMTAQQPFATDLICSNRTWFRYEWIWDRVNKYTNFLNTARQPMRRHELVLVFAAGAHTYNAQKARRATPYTSRRTRGSEVRNYGAIAHGNMGEVIEDQHPSSIIEFEGNMTTGILHPTQKPVGLMRYLVETYTNPGDVVLDCFCGSGTTPLAAKQVGRHYLGCDGESKYVQIARGRLDAEFSFGPLGGGGRGVSVAPATEAKKNGEHSNTPEQTS